MAPITMFTDLAQKEAVEDISALQIIARNATESCCSTLTSFNIDNRSSNITENDVNIWQLNFKFQRYENFCKTTAIVTTFINLTNMAMIFLISVDRFLYINYSLTYHSYVTIKRAIVSIVVTYIFFMILSIMGGVSAIQIDHRHLNNVLHFCTNSKFEVWFTTVLYIIMVILSTLTFGFYIKIALIAKQNVKIVAPHVISGENSATTNLTQNPKIKIKMYVLILGSYFALYFPVTLILMLRLSMDSSALEIIYYLTWLILYCNNFINPIIYVWYSKDFRVAFYKLLCCR